MELLNFTLRSCLCVGRYLILEIYSDMEEKENEQALLFKCQCIKHESINWGHHFYVFYWGHLVVFFFWTMLVLMWHSVPKIFICRELNQVIHDYLKHHHEKKKTPFCCVEHGEINL